MFLQTINRVRNPRSNAREAWVEAAPTFFPPPLAEFRLNFSHESSSSAGMYIVSPSDSPKLLRFISTRDLFNGDLYYLWVSLEVVLAHQNHSSTISDAKYFLLTTTYSSILYTEKNPIVIHGHFAYKYTTQKASE